MEGIDQFLLVGGSLLKTSKPVSYTHLDVYKRQLLYYDPEWDTNGNGSYDEGESYQDYLAWQRVGTVSYTHLDVYKRQNVR